MVDFLFAAKPTTNPASTKIILEVVWELLKFLGPFIIFLLGLFISFIVYFYKKVSRTIYGNGSKEYPGLVALVMQNKKERSEDDKDDTPLQESLKSLVEEISAIKESIKPNQSGPPAHQCECCNRNEIPNWSELMIRIESIEKDVDGLANSMIKIVENHGDWTKSMMDSNKTVHTLFSALLNHIGGNKDG
jgi:hypothetical protein